MKPKKPKTPKAPAPFVTFPLPEEGKPETSLMLASETRAYECLDHLMQGRTRAFIVKEITEKYKVGARQVDFYIAKAREIVSEHNLHTYEYNASIISENLWELYRRSLRKDDLGEAHRVLMSIAKLKGVDKQVVNHKITVTSAYADLSDDALDAALDAEVTRLDQTDD